MAIYFSNYDSVPVLLRNGFPEDSFISIDDKYPRKIQRRLKNYHCCDKIQFPKKYIAGLDELSLICKMANVNESDTDKYLAKGKDYPTFVYTAYLLTSHIEGYDYEHIWDDLDGKVIITDDDYSPAEENVLSLRDILFAFLSMSKKECIDLNITGLVDSHFDMLNNSDVGKKENDEYLFQCKKKLITSIITSFWLDNEYISSDAFSFKIIKDKGRLNKAIDEITSQGEEKEIVRKRVMEHVQQAEEKLDELAKSITIDKLFKDSGLSLFYTVYKPMLATVNRGIFSLVFPGLNKDKLELTEYERTQYLILARKKLAKFFIISNINHMSKAEGNEQFMPILNLMSMIYEMDNTIDKWAKEWDKTVANVHASGKKHSSTR